MNSSSEKKLRVAIIGGGISGLTCAIALKDHTNIESNLYEAAAQLTEIGAGITIWPRTWSILKTMGLDEDVISILSEEPKTESTLVWTFRKSDQHDGFHIFDLYNNGGILAFHRQDVQRVLLKRLPSSCQVHLKHRLDRHEEFEDFVKLYFENGVTSTHDVVIGADGIKSVVRRGLQALSTPPGDEDKIFNTGVTCYRGLIPSEKLASMYPDHPALERHMTYCGKFKHIVAYPISKGTIINVAGLSNTPEDAGKPLKNPQRKDATLDEVLDCFSGWEESAMQLLSAMETPMWGAIQMLKPLDNYVSRRTALVGDSAHAMTPYLGAGASTAIEDAYILGTLMSRSSCRSEDLPRILNIYNTVRQPFGNHMVKNSLSMVGHYHFLLPDYEGVGDVLSSEQLACFGEAIEKEYAWGWESPEYEVERALGML